jgi:hypothetical protein
VGSSSSQTAAAATVQRVACDSYTSVLQTSREGELMAGVRRVTMCCPSSATLSCSASSCLHQHYTLCSMHAAACLPCELPLTACCAPQVSTMKQHWPLPLAAAHARASACMVLHCMAYDHACLTCACPAVIEAPQVIAEAEAALESSSSSGPQAAAGPSSSGSKQINWYQQW